MLGSLPYKSKQFFIAIIKLSIIVGASYYIYNKLIYNQELSFSEFSSFLTKNDVFSPKNVLILLFLSVFNLFFEILKWKYLATNVKRISFYEALKQSLGGLTASLITPNRIGDYGAKAVYYAKQYRKRIVLLNLIGNVNQMTVTVFFGTIGLLFFYNNYGLDISLKYVLRFATLLVLVAAFSLFGLQHSRFKIKGYSLISIINFLKSLPITMHMSVFFLSILRYIIFSFQFYFLLQLFGIEITYKTAIIAISSMYLLSSIIPTLAAFDVLIKTSAAVFLFGQLGINELPILSISMLMWLLNFVLPSIFGSYFVLNFRLPNSSD